MNVIDDFLLQGYFEHAARLAQGERRERNLCLQKQGVRAQKIDTLPTVITARQGDGAADGAEYGVGNGRVDALLAIVNDEIVSHCRESLRMCVPQDVLYPPIGERHHRFIVHVDAPLHFLNLSNVIEAQKYDYTAEDDQKVREYVRGTNAVGTYGASMVFEHLL
jgi:hypothetical protein